MSNPWYQYYKNRMYSSRKRLDGMRELEDAAKAAAAIKAIRYKSAHAQLIASMNSTPNDVELELKFQVEPIVAYRVWKIVDFVTREGLVEKRISSVGVNGWWNPYRRMEAQCLHLPHEAPFPTCQCGMWAMKAEHNVAHVRAQYNAKVWGSVNLWGRVLSCTIGYRAQYAYPKELFTDEPGLVDQLATTYEVPVTCLTPVEATSDMSGWNTAAPSYLAPGFITATPNAYRGGGVSVWPPAGTLGPHVPNLGQQTGVQGGVSFNVSNAFGVQLSGGENDSGE